MERHICPPSDFVLLHCSGVDEMFGVDAMLDTLFRCFCNAQMLMYCSGVYTMLGSLYHIPVFIKTTPNSLSQILIPNS